MYALNALFILQVNKVCLKFHVKFNVFGMQQFHVKIVLLPHVQCNPKWTMTLWNPKPLMICIVMAIRGIFLYKDWKHTVFWEVLSSELSCEAWESVHQMIGVHSSVASSHSTLLGLEQLLLALLIACYGLLLAFPIFLCWSWLQHFPLESRVSLYNMSNIPHFWWQKIPQCFTENSNIQNENYIWCWNGFYLQCGMIIAY